MTEELSATEESFDDIVDRLEKTVNALGGTVQHLAGHVDKFTTELAHFNLAAAAREVPAAAREGIENTAATAGGAADTTLHAATVPVAVVEDAVRDAEGGEQKAKRVIRRGLRRRR